MQVDYIDPRIGVPLIIVLWVILFITIFRTPIKLKLDNYFAHRRHVRRERRRRALRSVNRY